MLSFLFRVRWAPMLVLAASPAWANSDQPQSGGHFAPLTAAASPQITSCTAVKSAGTSFLTQFTPADIGCWDAANPTDGVLEGNVVALGDLWNCSATACLGNAIMSFDSTSRSLTTTVNFTAVPSLIINSGEPIGYPNLLYGTSLYKINSLHKSSTQPIASFPLPATVSSIINGKTVQLLASYTTINTGYKIDIAYDMFLTQKEATAGTDSGQCGLGQFTELEIIIDEEPNTAAFDSDHFYDSISASVTINNNPQSNATWNIYYLQHNDKCTNKSTQENTYYPLIVFALSQPPNASIGASVSFDLRSILKYLASKNGPTKGSGITGRYINAIQLGSEFWPDTSSGAVHYSWTLSGFSLIQ